MSSAIPCVSIDKIKIPSIGLPAGAELTGLADFASGIPTDCKVNLSLVAQLGPLLASLACLLKVMEVLGNIVDFAKAAPDPFKMADKVGALVNSFTELSKCIPVLAPLGFVAMIKDILELIINVLSCLVDSLASITEFKLSLDFSGAEGNPALLEALGCAQRNADTSMENTMASVASLMTIMKVAGSLASLAQLPLTLPDLSQLGKAGDALQTIQELKKTVDALKAVIASLPG